MVHIILVLAVIALMLGAFTSGIHITLECPDEFKDRKGKLPHIIYLIGGAVLVLVYLACLYFKAGKP